MDFTFILQEIFEVKAVKDFVLIIIQDLPIHPMEMNLQKAHGANVIQEILET
jgi:hypothetical protein